LRDWLTREQKETRRGRAELLLADRAAVWNARPENRQLPLLSQWLQIEWLTAQKNWAPPQWKMMLKAGRYHVVRGAALGLLLAVATVTGLAIREQVIEQRKATQAAGLVQAILNADTVQVPAIVGAMAEYRKWATRFCVRNLTRRRRTPGQSFTPAMMRTWPFTPSTLSSTFVTLATICRSISSLIGIGQT